MIDQAQRLREIVAKSMPKKDPGEEKKKEKPKGDTRIITVSSGKGGVGKTSFTVNLGLALGRLGKRVVIIDADLGLANVDVVLGMVPRFNLNHIITGEKSIEEILIEGPEGVKVLSGGSGVLDLVNLDDEQIGLLIESFEFLNGISDYILIDTGAGIHKSVLSFIEAATDVIMVVTADPTSITDAYAVIKNIADEEKLIQVVVNKASNQKEAEDVFMKINNASRQFLKRDLENLGYVYEDKNVRTSVKNQTPYMMAYPNSLASKGVELIAQNIDRKDHVPLHVSGFSRFMNRLFSQF